MTNDTQRLDTIEARFAHRERMVNDGTYKVTRTRCNDPESCSTHWPHPKRVTTETSHHDSYISHLEALADHVPFLLELARKQRDELWKRNEMITGLKAALEVASAARKVMIKRAREIQDALEGK